MNSSPEINPFINHVYSKNRFSSDEFQTICHYAKQKFDTLLEQYGNNDELADFQQLINLAIQMMENSLQKNTAKTGKCEQKNKIKAGFISQMLYMFANFDRAFSSL
ncbi:MAG TPA: hypothetical protein ACHBX6_10345 [Arsenophonus nasoniae]